MIKMVQHRGLEGVWAARGAYRGVLVVASGILGVSWGVLGASWRRLGPQKPANINLSKGTGSASILLNFLGPRVAFGGFGCGTKSIGNFR